jgi:hypothetical protein
MPIAEHNCNAHSMAASLILKVTYGIQVESSSDPYVDIAKEAMHGLSVASIPGAFLVVSSILYPHTLLSALFFEDTIPALKYVPSWVPGAGFQRQAKKWRKVTRDLLDLPFAQAKQSIVHSGSLRLGNALIARLTENGHRAVLVHVRDSRGIEFNEYY